MATSLIRLVCLLLIIFAGFRRTLFAKLASQTGYHLALLIVAVDIAGFAVMMPEKPLMPMLVPLLTVMILDRSQTLLWRVIDDCLFHDAAVSYRRNDIRSINREKACLASQRNGHPPAGLSLIENGKVRGDHLMKIGKTQLWLRRELRKFGYRNIRQVNYLTIDTLGNFYMDLKNCMRHD